MSISYKLRVSKIEKSFPGVKALDNVNFAVRKGTVHAICGENGAGKSTLMKIICGIYSADAGEIFIDDKLVHIKGAIAAKRLGIAMIPQELNFVPEMTIEENLYYGRLPTTKFKSVDWKKIRKDTIEFLKKENLPYSPTQKLKLLSVSDIQMLEIMKAVSVGAQIVVMDEPTSSITQREVDILFEKIKKLKENGTSIIYISHKMDEVFKIADDITIFRDGRSIESRSAKNTEIDEVITLMVGRKLESVYPKEKVDVGDIILEVSEFSGIKKFTDISFNLRKGEIVGFAGLVGAGRTEVMRAVFGLDPKIKGTIKINGETVTIKNTTQSIKNKLVMLSEDRRRYGIIPMRSVMENTTISKLDKFLYNGYLHKNEEIATTKEYFKKLNVKTPTLETPISSLSGGNQQKILLARWILCDPDILILDEPTRGIDVGAKFEIYKLIIDIVKQGKGIIIVSSELPELIGMCDRIYVMNQGFITGELNRDEFSQEAIMHLATSAHKEVSAC